jgi:hypothetical protein
MLGPSRAHQAPHKNQTFVFVTHLGQKFSFFSFVNFQAPGDSSS